MGEAHPHYMPRFEEVRLSVRNFQYRDGQLEPGVQCSQTVRLQADLTVHNRNVAFHR